MHGRDGKCIQNYSEEPLREPRLRCESNTEINLKGIGWKSVHWINVAQIFTGDEIL
jgi:hypothetical protein